jgi:type II secretory pathway predicted ATPase ExeA
MVRDPAAADLAFSGSPEPETFLAAGPHDEALARLEWLAGSGRRCGLVVGDSGLGKSHLLAATARRLAGLGAEVAVLSLGGLGPDDWLEMLVERLPLDPASRAEPLRPWQKLENRLRENMLMERTTALLFDDLDRGPADALEGIVRLVGAVEPRFARTLVVATATAANLDRIPMALRRAAGVRIELTPWNESLTAEFLRHELVRTGGSPDRFTAEAAGTLARCAGGVPRDVVNLARLALAAAAGDGIDRVDSATVERAWRELSPGCPEVPSRSMAEEERSGGQIDPTTEPARVRVVRRLWG